MKELLPVREFCTAISIAPKKTSVSVDSECGRIYCLQYSEWGTNWVLLCLLLPQGDWIYNKMGVANLPWCPTKYIKLFTYLKSPAYVPHTSKSHCEVADALQVSNHSTGQEATRMLTDLVTTSCCSLWWPLLPIPELIHQNIAAAAHAEHSWLRKQLPHCLWATRASRVIGSPLLILFQLFYWAAGSKKKAACSQKCIFPFCEIRPAPESLISLSQIRNLSYSQFTLAEN